MIVCVHAAILNVPYMGGGGGGGGLCHILFYHIQVNEDTETLFSCQLCIFDPQILITVIQAYLIAT